MGLDFTVVLRNLDYLLWGRLTDGELGGLLLTVVMAVSAGILSLALGIALAMVAWRCQASRKLLFLWAELIRGIPLIFVIFWLYFLVPALFGGGIPNALSVILALAWFSSAAIMHSVLAGLQSLPRSQYEAGIASGLAEHQVLCWILLPQALRNLIPSFVGLFASLIKDTSLAFIVNVPELTTVASQVNNRTQLFPTEIFLSIAAMYFVLCGVLSLAARAVCGPSSR
ncbi:amino acid ABC transporter permease [Telmatospirillum sp.]|uniref:amino acid ABC transporter permease n=1 Tax=Telmatospirillum sp. TaxID=2079197 RepID=UPI00285235F1|nr:amino acid ABC transporter permease [Telmatospirillum sp.]MDR3437431.1 amino acid ABC transporter permease [Telmatospirillum sp.]